MFGKYKVVHLVGSTRGNGDIFRKAEKYLTEQGYIVFKPVFYNLEEYEPNMDMYNDMCYEKLLVCDIVCITTPEHIGESTRNRIKQAKSLNKDIWVFDGVSIKEYQANNEENL